MPSRDSNRDQVMEDAIAATSRIPTDLDRLDRYAMLAEDFADLNSKMSKRCLKEAIAFSSTAGDQFSLHSRHRRIIDIAHKIDPHFAATLASVVDEDPARAKTYRAVKKRLKFLDAKKKMLDASTDLKSFTSKRDYPEAAWMNLGSLNAGRIETLHPDFMRNYVEAAAELPLNMAYPIFAWAVENATQRYAKTAQANTHLLPMFEATMLGAELAARIASRSSGHVKLVTEYASRTGESNSIVIRPGNRERQSDFARLVYHRRNRLRQDM